MKKILFVMPSLRTGGAERSLVNLLCELPPDTYEIDLLLFKKIGAFLLQIPSYVNILDQPFALKRLYAPVLKTGRYMLVKVIGNGLSKVLKRGVGEQKAFVWEYFYKHFIGKLGGEYDVAIGYLGGETTYYIVDKVNAKRKIHWVHSDYRASRMPKKYDLELFKKVNVVVTVSKGCLEILKKEFPEFMDKFCCIENITSSVVIKKQAEEFYPKEYIGIQNILLSIGRLSEEKGFDMAIKAAAKMKKEGIRFRWFILGSGSLKNKLTNQIRREQVSDVVTLLGARVNPYPYIKNCDIFVQPSRYEGKSVVIDEAKIMAKPIVVTSYPTVDYQIKNGRDGIIVGMTPSDIANGIKLLLSNSDKRRQIEQHLSKENNGNQEEVIKYIDLFEQA